MLCPSGPAQKDDSVILVWKHDFFVTPAPKIWTDKYKPLQWEHKIAMNKFNIIFLYSCPVFPIYKSS